MPKIAKKTLSVERSGKYWNFLIDHAREYLCNELTPKQLEDLVGLLFHRMGFNDVEVSGGTGDGGVDIRCTYVPEFGLPTTEFSIQVKQKAEGNISPSFVNQIRGAGTARKSTGMLVTTTDFSKKARESAEESDPKVVLMTGKELAARLIEYNLWPDLFERHSDFFTEAKSELSDSLKPENETNEISTELIPDSNGDSHSENEDIADSEILNILQKYPNLMRNTDVLEFQVKGFLIEKNSLPRNTIGWNPVLRHCLAMALNKKIDVYELCNLVPIKSHPMGKNGYAPVPESDYLSPGFSADKSCDHLRELSVLLNSNIAVKFRWNFKAPEHLKGIEAIIRFNNGDVSITSTEVPEIVDLINRD